jgi:hypothetical protein
VFLSALVDRVSHDLNKLLLTQSAPPDMTRSYLRVHHLMKWDYVVTLHRRVCQVFAYHFSFSSMMGAEIKVVPSKKRSRSWNKSGLEQKPEQVLSN